MHLSEEQSEAPNWPRSTLRRTDQRVAGVLTACSLLAILVWCLLEWRRSGQLIDIDLAGPLVAEFRLDVNSAQWPELALLPNIGEQLAKRLVAERAQNGPFRDLADLRRVRGIGPRTLESIEPFLLPLSPVETTAGSPRQPAQVVE